MAINMIGHPGMPKPAARQDVPAPTREMPAIVPESAPWQQPGPEEIRQAVDSLRQLVESKAPNSLQFSIDDATGRTIVKITDAQTGETIRQIPPKEMLEIAQSLDKMRGLLLKQEA